MNPVWIPLLVLTAISLFYGGTSIWSIFRKLSRHTWINESLTQLKLNNDYRAAILLPFYKEQMTDIEITFRSIVRQRYPKDLLDVYIILERGDAETLNHVVKLISIFDSNGIRYEIVFHESVRRGKASALNSVLKYITRHKDYDLVVVYDAGDIVEDEYYIAKVSLLISRGFDVVGTRVYRVGKNVIGRLSYLDTLLWYHVALPGLTKITGYPLLSGEGLTLSMRFLKLIGGFPEKLTEDSYITLYLASLKGRAALLNSLIIEGAPSSLKSLVRQRLRWYRGYFECLKDLLTQFSSKLGLSSTVKLMIAYAEPLALISTLTSFVILTLSPLIYIPSPLFWTAFTSTILMFLAPLYVVLDLSIKDYVVLLAPIYWLVQGVIALVALIPIRIPWYRTSRSKLEVSNNITL